MMDAKIIKTEEEYEAALARVYALMDAQPDSPEENELVILGMLVEKYEKEHYPIELPDPIEVIKVCMEDEGLTQKDLVPYIGSPSRVSEVLNRKRPLNLAMIRALNAALKIPLEVLVGKMDDVPYDWRDVPFNEMFKFGYFPDFKGTLQEARKNADILLRDLFSVLGNQNANLVYCRKSKADIQENALRAWLARASHLAMKQEIPPFSRKDLPEDFVKQVVKLSYFSQGAQMAIEYLNKSGIHFVTLRHLPKTHLDGACFIAPDGHPTIAMTLRWDRQDNFWFTLAHELAHLILHLDKIPDRAFFDDTESSPDEAEILEETEANGFARDALIPPDVWANFSGLLLSTNDEQDLISFSQMAITRIHPAIVAGRVRWETQDYRRFSSLVSSPIRQQFPQFN